MTDRFSRESARRAAASLFAGVSALALVPAASAAQAVPAADTVRAAAPAQPETRVTLDEAVRRSLEASPAVAQGAGTVRSARAGERSAKGAFLPTLSASASSSLGATQQLGSQTGLGDGFADAYGAGISASVPVYTGGRRTAELRQARAETSAAEATLEAQRFDVVLATKRTFFDVLRADELIRVSDAQVKRAEEALEAAELRLRVGSATRSDVLRARLELNDARQALAQARSDREVAGFALGRAVGAPGPVAAEQSEPLRPTPLAVPAESLAALVTTRAPAVRAEAAGVTAAEAGMSAARAQYRPTVTLGTGADWANQDPTLAGNANWDLRLGVSIPLFDGFQREAGVERARVQADVARVQLADAERAARAGLERTLSALRLAEQRIGLAEEAVQVAEEDLRVQDQRYRMGSSTMLERLASQTALTQAESDLVAARYDYQLARAELEALVGREL
ncbi:MAG: TolC family protein [Gemmatimonadota bacterium]